MNRRTLIPLFVGLLAALAGFATVAYLRQGRCVGAGGRWEATSRHCTLPAGSSVTVAHLSDLIAGAAVAIVLAFMLFRMTTLAASRSSRT
jgi:hypothetical protein